MDLFAALRAPLNGRATSPLFTEGVKPSEAIPMADSSNNFLNMLLENRVAPNSEPPQYAKAGIPTEYTSTETYKKAEPETSQAQNINTTPAEESLKSSIKEEQTTSGLNDKAKIRQEAPVNKKEKPADEQVTVGQNVAETASSMSQLLAKITAKQHPNRTKGSVHAKAGDAGNTDTLAQAKQAATKQKTISNAAAGIQQFLKESGLLIPSTKVSQLSEIHSTLHLTKDEGKSTKNSLGHKILEKADLSEALTDKKTLHPTNHKGNLLSKKEQQNHQQGHPAKKSTIQASQLVSRETIPANAANVNEKGESTSKPTTLPKSNFAEPRLSLNTSQDITETNIQKPTLQNSNLRAATQLSGFEKTRMHRQFENVLQQARLSVRDPGNATLTTRLFQRDMGSVLVNLSLVEGALSARFTVGNETVQRELMQYLNNLHNDGFTLSSFSVHVGGQALQERGDTQDSSTKSTYAPAKAGADYEASQGAAQVASAKGGVYA